MLLPMFHSARLDFIRGLAVLLVVTVHTSQVLGNGLSTSKWILPFGQEFLNFGARGVQVFFLLSAFSLANSYSHHLKHQKKTYFIRRFFRIYPVWVVAVLIHGFAKNRFEFIPANLSFIFGITRGTENNPELVGGSWTLFIEILFYIVFPFIFPIVKRTKLLLFLLFSLVITRIVWLNSASVWLGIDDRNSFIGLFPLSNFYCFAVGLFVFNLVLSEWKLTSPFDKPGLPLLLLFVSITMKLDQVIQVFLLGYWLYLILSNPMHEIEFKDPASRIVRLLGKYAFTIYLYHLYLLEISGGFLLVLCQFTDFIELRLLVTLPLVLAVLTCTGALGFRFIESPSVEIGKALIRKITSRKDDLNA